VDVEAGEEAAAEGVTVITEVTTTKEETAVVEVPTAERTDEELTLDGR
jgi:hypothetical protein